MCVEAGDLPSPSWIGSRECVRAVFVPQIARCVLFAGTLEDEIPTEGGIMVASIVNSLSAPCRPALWPNWSMVIMLKLFCSLCLVNGAGWM